MKIFSCCISHGVSVPGIYLTAVQKIGENAHGDRNITFRECCSTCAKTCGYYINSISEG